MEWHMTESLWISHVVRIFETFYGVKGVVSPIAQKSINFVMMEML